MAMQRESYKPIMLLGLIANQIDFIDQMTLVKTHKVSTKDLHQSVAIFEWS